MNQLTKFTPQAMREAIGTSEVKEAMKTLSKYGLAVWLPHIHAEDGSFLPLTDDIVQIEVEGDEPMTRKVTFVKRNTLDPEKLKRRAVAWIWNDSMEMAVVATSCEDLTPDGPHD
ncbi:MAG TPA: hypothetical protein DDW51_18625 [Cyanobacteria bacterium UBA11367]|nr:hypothetical protein [Cyanobacteria bacterium UBA11367]